MPRSKTPRLNETWNETRHAQSSISAPLVPEILAARRCVPTLAWQAFDRIQFPFPREARNENFYVFSAKREAFVCNIFADALGYNIRICYDQLARESVELPMKKS